MRRLPLTWPDASRAGARGAFDTGTVREAYVKTNKNDFIDAEANAEALGRPPCALSRSRLTINWTCSHYIACENAGQCENGRGQSDAWVGLERVITLPKGRCPLDRGGLTHDFGRWRCEAIGSTRCSAIAAEAVCREATAIRSSSFPRLCRCVVIAMRLESRLKQDSSSVIDR